MWEGGPAARSATRVGRDPSGLEDSESDSDFGQHAGDKKKDQKYKHAPKDKNKAKIKKTSSGSAPAAESGPQASLDGAAAIPALRATLRSGAPTEIEKKAEKLIEQGGKDFCPQTLWDSKVIKFIIGAY